MERDVATLKRRRVDAARLLTAEDFALIRKLKQAQKEMLLDPKQRAKSKVATASAAADAVDGEATDGITFCASLSYDGFGTDFSHCHFAEDFNGPQFSVLPESLAAGMRTGRMSKIERIRNVLEGRKEAGVRWEHEVRLTYPIFK